MVPVDEADLEEQLMLQVQDLHVELDQKDEELQRYKDLWQQCDDQLKQIKKELDMTGEENHEMTVELIRKLKEQREAMENEVSKLEKEKHRIEQKAETLEIDINTLNIQLHELTAQCDIEIFRRAQQKIRQNFHRRTRATAAALPKENLKLNLSQEQAQHAHQLPPTVDISFPTLAGSQGVRGGTGGQSMNKDRCPKEASAAMNVMFCVLCRRKFADAEVSKRGVKTCRFHYGAVVNDAYTCCGLTPDQYTGCFPCHHFYVTKGQNGEHVLTDGSVIVARIAASELVKH